MYTKINMDIKDKIEEAVTIMSTRYVKEGNAEAIYMNNFYSLSRKEPVIEIVAVFVNEEDYLRDIDNDDIINKTYKETGILINPKYRFDCEYTYTLLDFESKTRAQELKNGYLLYDRNGKFKELKDYLTYKNREVLLLKYQNSIVFNPPLRLKKIKNSVTNSIKKEEF